MQLRQALCVTYRQFLSWRTNWRSFVLYRLIDPLIFFLGLNLGMSHYIPSIGGVDYISFLLPGSICMTIMFSALFEGTYNAYTRAFIQRTWFSFLATPTKVGHIILGETLWCIVRTMMSCLMLVVVGIVAGAQVSLLGTLMAIPFMILTIAALVGFAYAFMGFANSINDFDYIWALIATPMMVFSGVMVNIDVFPQPVQMLSWLLPLTHATQVIRPLMVGQIDSATIALHGAVLLVLAGVGFTLANYRLTRKLLS